MDQDLLSYFSALSVPPRTKKGHVPWSSLASRPSPTVPPAPHALFFFLHLFFCYSFMMPSHFCQPPAVIPFSKPWHCIQESHKKHRWPGEHKSEWPCLSGHAAPPTTRGATHIVVYVNDTLRDQALKCALQTKHSANLAAYTLATVPSLSCLLPWFRILKTGIQFLWYPHS